MTKTTEELEDHWVLLISGTGANMKVWSYQRAMNHHKWDLLETAESSRFSGKLARLARRIARRSQKRLDKEEIDNDQISESNNDSTESE